MSVLSSLRGRRSPAGTDVERATEPGGAAPTEASTAPTPVTAPEDFTLTPAQKRFFDTFGFVSLPGLFAAEIDRIVAGFEEVFEAERGKTFDTNVALHFDEKRSIVASVVDKSEDLRWLKDDPRVDTIVRTLVGGPYDYAESDGNLFYCDTSWHPDNYAAPMTHFHVKLSFYLDPLHGESGAIRMIPGTNHWMSPYAQAVRESVDDPAAIEEIFGVRPDQIPSWTLESEPGDVVVWNFRTVHASFNGGERRRLFSMNFREHLDDA